MVSQHADFPLEITSCFFFAENAVESADSYQQNSDGSCGFFPMETPHHFSPRKTMT